MTRFNEVVSVVEAALKDKLTAEQIVEKLVQEGVILQGNDPKDLVIGYGNQSVDNVLRKFKDTFGNTKSTKWDRYAAKRMVDKHTEQAVITAIDILGRSTDQYAPVVNSVSQLENKWVSVVAFIRKSMIKAQSSVPLDE